MIPSRLSVMMGAAASTSSTRLDALVLPWATPPFSEVYPIFHCRRGTLEPGCNAKIDTRSRHHDVHVRRIDKSYGHLGTFPTPTSSVSRNKGKPVLPVHLRISPPSPPEQLLTPATAPSPPNPSPHRTSALSTISCHRSTPQTIWPPLARLGQVRGATTTLITLVPEGHETPRWTRN